jgi:hypothetical protein
VRCGRNIKNICSSSIRMLGCLNNRNRIARSQINGGDPSFPYAHTQTQGEQDVQRCLSSITNCFDLCRSFSSQSLLVKVHPPVVFTSFHERIQKLLQPTQQVLGILHESLASGEQQKFALRLWEKACSGDPLLLASRTCSHAYQRWKDKDQPPDESDKTGST